jgi:hypothetical protein
MKKPKLVYVVFRAGNNDFELGLNVYDDFENAKKMWEDRTGKLYDESKQREYGCYLRRTYINS